MYELEFIQSMANHWVNHLRTWDKEMLKTDLEIGVNLPKDSNVDWLWCEGKIPPSISSHYGLYAVRPSQSLNNLVCVRLATTQAIKTRLFVDNSLLPWMDSFALRRTSKSRLLRWNINEPQVINWTTFFHMGED